MLSESRGATLEAVVSRMKTISTSIRFLAISATIPNIADIAKWLAHGTADEYSETEVLRGETHYDSVQSAVYKVYGEIFRPVKLDKIVLGYPKSVKSSDFVFDTTLDQHLMGIIDRYSSGKPVLIVSYLIAFIFIFLVLQYTQGD